MQTSGRSYCRKSRFLETFKRSVFVLFFWLNICMNRFCCINFILNTTTVKCKVIFPMHIFKLRSPEVPKMHNVQTDINKSFVVISVDLHFCIILQWKYRSVRSYKERILLVVQVFQVKDFLQSGLNVELSVNLKQQ